MITSRAHFTDGGDWMGADPRGRSCHGPRRRRGWLRGMVAGLAWPALLAGDGAPPRSARFAPPVELAWQGSFYMEGGRADSWMQRRFEEEFNVRLRVGFLPAFSYDRQLMFTLMGGGGPDVFWVRDAREARRAADHGFALELPYEVLARHAPAYLRQVQRHAPEAWLLTNYDGRNFGLPTFNVTWAPHPSPAVWNRTWLERVGITQVPETLEEMEEALRRFRERDPDGNGRQDTYGYCPWKPPAPPGIVDRSFDEIFGAYGILQTGWMEREGRLVWGGTLPEAKEVLRLLRRWYAEGLIFPDYMVVPAGNIEVRKWMINGTVGYINGWYLGMYENFDREFPISLLNLHRAVHPGEELVPARFPLGPGGRRGGRTYGGTLTGIVMLHRRLAQEPAKLERVLRIFDELARDQELALELRIGERGRHWEWEPQRGFRLLPPYDRSKALAGWELLGEFLPDPGSNFAYFVPFSADRDVVRRFTPARRREFTDRYQRPEWGLCDALVWTENTPQGGKYLPDLVRLQVVAFTEIITGQRPLDAFGQFVQEWHMQGGQIVTREANALHARKAAILAAVSAHLGEAPAGP